MYKEHIFCKEYKELKDIIIDIMNGEDVDYDIDEIKEYIQEIYDDDRMPSTQYDELMSYIQDLE